ncbi:nucleotidyltransferase [candidate division KSB1 bacterium]|nr:MAG: nucleotidyltransferase [candidate division KSB1 bacterium]
MLTPQIPIDRDKIAAFCKKWSIVEFSFFGSVLTDEFRPDSDVDVLVEFADDAPWTLLDMVDMENELQAIFERDVDLLTRSSVSQSENYLMRRSILAGTRSFYAAR